MNNYYNDNFDAPMNSIFGISSKIILDELEESRKNIINKELYFEDNSITTNNSFNFMTMSDLSLFINEAKVKFEDYVSKNLFTSALTDIILDSMPMDEVYKTDKMTQETYKIVRKIVDNSFSINNINYENVSSKINSVFGILYEKACEYVALDAAHRFDVNEIYDRLGLDRNKIGDYIRHQFENAYIIDHDINESYQNFVSMLIGENEELVQEISNRVKNELKAAKQHKEEITNTSKEIEGMKNGGSSTSQDISNIGDISNNDMGNSENMGSDNDSNNDGENTDDYEDSTNDNEENNDDNTDNNGKDKSDETTAEGVIFGEGKAEVKNAIKLFREFLKQEGIKFSISMPLDGELLTDGYNANVRIKLLRAWIRGSNVGYEKKELEDLVSKFKKEYKDKIDKHVEIRVVQDPLYGDPAVNFMYGEDEIEDESSDFSNDINKTPTNISIDIKNINKFKNIYDNIPKMEIDTISSKNVTIDLNTNDGVVCDYKPLEELNLQPTTNIIDSHLFETRLPKNYVAIKVKDFTSMFMGVLIEKFRVVADLLKKNFESLRLPQQFISNTNDSLISNAIGTAIKYEQNIIMLTACYMNTTQQINDMIRKIVIPNCVSEILKNDSTFKTIIKTGIDGITLANDYVNISFIISNNVFTALIYLNKKTYIDYSVDSEFTLSVIEAESQAMRRAAYEDGGKGYEKLYDKLSEQFVDAAKKGNVSKLDETRNKIQTTLGSVIQINKIHNGLYDNLVDKFKKLSSSITQEVNKIKTESFNKLKNDITIFEKMMINITKKNMKMATESAEVEYIKKISALESIQYYTIFEALNALRIIDLNREYDRKEFEKFIETLPSK